MCIFESFVENIAPYLTEIDSKLLLPEFTLISGRLGTGSVVVNFLVLHIHSVLLVLCGHAHTSCRYNIMSTYNIPVLATNPAMP